MATTDTKAPKAPKQTFEQRIAAMVAKEAAKNQPKEVKVTTTAQPRVKGRDIAKAMTMFEKGHKMIADALAIMNQKEEKPESYKLNETKYPEITGAYFGRDGKGFPMLPSGKLSTEANKAAFAKAYPDVVAMKKKGKDKPNVAQVKADAKNEVNDIFTTSKGTTLKVPGMGEGQKPAAPATVPVVKLQDQKPAEAKK